MTRELSETCASSLWPNYYRSVNIPEYPDNRIYRRIRIDNCQDTSTLHRYSRDATSCGAVALHALRLCIRDRTN
eukprot:1608679-Pleurochrysis_carterae.AAC.3